MVLIQHNKGILLHINVIVNAACVSIGLALDPFPWYSLLIESVFCNHGDDYIHYYHSNQTS